jgi:hypothetical protein
MPEHGGFEDRIKRNEIAIRDIQLARRLESASIGAGGLTFKDGGKATFLDTSGNTLFTIDENGLITFEADGSQMSVLDAGKLRFNRADGTRQLEITPAGGLKVYAANGTTVRSVLDGDGLDIGAGLTTITSTGVTVGTDVVIDSTGLHVEGGDVVATYTDVKEGSASGITLTDTFAEFGNATFTLPSWVASAKVLATAYTQASNTSGGQLSILSSCRVNDVDDGAAQVSVPNGSVGQAVHLDESTIDTAVDGFSVQISAYGRHTGTSPGDDLTANAIVWGIIIGYAT